MKTLLALGLVLFFAATAFAQVKYISGYSRRDGSYVSGHYRDTSNDGNPYNNASYLGYNRHRPEGIY